MTPAEYRQTRDAAHLTNAQVAALTGRGRNTPSFWEAGTYTIPSDVADWLRSLAAWWVANPPPVGRGRRSSDRRQDRAAD